MLMYSYFYIFNMYQPLYIHFVVTLALLGCSAPNSDVIQLLKISFKEKHILMN
uniref:Uncharacterized protein n=1 Tax=Octopus bimaculoides TaxID=37653 RepID=A0A0L8H544_OCTBM